MWHKGHGWPWLGERLDLMIFEASSNWAILRCDAVRMLKTDGYLKEKIILGKTFGVAIPPICRNRCHASFSSQILISRSLVPVVQVVVTFSLLFCCSQTQLLFPYSTSSNYLNFPINIDSSSCISSWILILVFFVESVCLMHIWLTALLERSLCLWELAAMGTFLAWDFGFKEFCVCLPWLESFSFSKAPGFCE